MVDEYIEWLARWYGDQVRPLLVQHVPERIEAIDRDLDRLRLLRSSGQQGLPICFLGNSGVGKSTLLNAMVAGELSVLPQGGVGPLTAQATVVCFSRERFFRATYLPRRNLNMLLFGLERHHEARLRQAGQPVQDRGGEVVQGLSPEELRDLNDGMPEVEVRPDEPADDKLEGMIRQAKLMILGQQFAEAALPYLLDALRLAIGQQPRWGTTLRPEHALNLDGVREALERATRPAYERRAGADMAGFLQELYLHAAGYLSPLIRTLEVGWDAPFLSNGVQLVDLPGLGVANDEYRKVTTDYIRTARAVVLVVDRSGFSEASADLLRSTGFLNALLHESHETETLPVHLLVAVTKLDQVAEDERDREKQTRPTGARRWIEHFNEACEKSVSLLRSQVRENLARIAEEGPEQTRDERRAALDRIRDSLEVHPVSGREYRRLLLNEEDEPARIKSVEQSRVPQLIEAVQRVSEEHSSHVRAQLLSAARDVHTRLVNLLGLLQTQWETDVRAEEEAAQLQRELAQFLEPLRSQLLVRQGGFREFLRVGVPREIESRLAEAALTAKEDIGRYVRRLENYHWATLRAAVRRGGTYVGARHVDLANELTLRFEEPVAVVWSKHILSVLRSRTRELGDDYVQMVGEVVGWAQGQGTRVQPKLVEALHQDLKGEVRGLSSVGREEIDKLREKVKTQLVDKVGDRVRRKCLEFVDSKRDQGTGVKKRLIHFFHDELVAAVVDAATPVARRVLSGNYEEVQQEISSTFERFKDPLERAAAEIVNDERSRMRRSDAQRRKKVLELLQQALSAQEGQAEKLTLKAKVAS